MQKSGLKVDFPFGFIGVSECTSDAGRNSKAIVNHQTIINLLELCLKMFPGPEKKVF
jgi:hypothetical protein